MSENLELKIRQSLAIIQKAVDDFSLDAVFALVSGGDDSLALLDIVRYHPRFAGVIHIDTLTGITDTASWKYGQNESIATRHVTEVCERNKFSLIVKTPFTQYDQLVIKYGFPAPAQHGTMYQMLKERPLRQAKIDARKFGGKRIGFVTGARSSESIRRFANVTESHWHEGVAWIPAIKHWNKSDCLSLLAESRHDRNPVSLVMGMSGECGCGAFATPNEKRVIDHYYPQTGQRINHLEEGVRHFAQVNRIDAVHCRWGNAKGKRINDKQLELQGFELCVSCVGSQMNRELNMRKIAKEQSA